MNIPTLISTTALATLALLFPVSHHASAQVATGNGAHTYTTVPGWIKPPEGRELGSTHGQMVIDKAGNVYVTTDEDLSVAVFAPDGSYLRSFDEKFRGVHGMTIREENGEEFIYAAHLSHKQILKFKTDGSVVWHINWPKESGHYKNKAEYKPTDVTVAPDGSIYIADGYGKNFIHHYDADQKYIRSFGGTGKGKGKFKRCHGIELDTRYEKPLLLVSDRKNNRLQHFDLDGNFVAVITRNLRRPCSVSIHGKFVAIAELKGRVTIIDETNTPVAFLGDNPDTSQWAKHPIPRSAWKEGIFTAPHGVTYDAEGNLFVMNWNKTGRVTKLLKN